MLFGAMLPLSCSVPHGNGSDVCLSFIEYIAEGSYGAAYDLLSDSVKNTTGTATKPGDPMIGASEFAEKYEQIFEAVGLKEISYIVRTVSDASITSSVDFQMTYDTSFGEMVNDYTINAAYENGRWGVLWTPALIFPTMEWGDKLLVGINYPKRGEIFDCNGELLVKNLSPITIYCVPNHIPAEKKEEVIKQILSIPILKPSGTPADEYEELVRKAINSTNSSAVIAKLYPDQMDDALEERLLAIDGIGIDKNAALTSTRFREYPYGRSASHLLGFASIMWETTWKDIKKKREAAASKNATEEDIAAAEAFSVYEKDSWMGYAGLEQQYEELLRGQKGGYAYIQGLDGTNRKTLYINEAIDGQDLHLTLDIKMQQRVEEVVKTVVYDSSISGTVIVMNPRTGAIEAMYSFPDYDVERVQPRHRRYRGVRSAGKGPADADVEPRDSGSLCARIDVQAVHRRGRAGSGRRHARNRVPEERTGPYPHRALYHVGRKLEGRMGGQKKANTPTPASTRSPAPIPPTGIRR